jgi:hypothetical protein
VNYRFHVKKKPHVGLTWITAFKKNVCRNSTLVSPRRSRPLLVAVVIVAWLSATLSVTAQNAARRADLSRLVVVGDSLLAGVQNFEELSTGSE